MLPYTIKAFSDGKPIPSPNVPGLKTDPLAYLRNKVSYEPSPAKQPTGGGTWKPSTKSKLPGKIFDENFFNLLKSYFSGALTNTFSTAAPPTNDSDQTPASPVYYWNPRGGSGKSPASPKFYQPGANGEVSPGIWSPRGGTSPYNNAFLNQPVTYSGLNQPVNYSGLEGSKYPENYWPGNFNNWNDIRRVRDWLEEQALAETAGGGGDNNPVYYSGYGGGWGGYGGGGGRKYKAPYDFYFNLLNWRI
jgi:hypothetical protein